MARLADVSAARARCVWLYAVLSNRRQGLTVPLPSRPDLIRAPRWRRLRLAPRVPSLDARLKAAHDAEGSAMTRDAIRLSCNML